MSDLDTAFAETMAELEAADTTPVDSGQGDVGVETATTEPTEDFFDLSTVADKKVRVKVGGEELAVPLAELPQGYMRQADYTRKTQELAQQRQAVEQAILMQQALDSNPAEALRLMATVYGVELTPAQQAVVDADQAANYADPLETKVQETFGALDSRLAQIEEFARQQEVAAARAQIESELSQLKATYGDLVDEQAVVETAVRMGGIPVSQAFRLVAFDVLAAKQLATTEFTAAEQAAEAQRLAAKQELTGIVSGGSSSAAAATQAAVRTESLEDAFMQAAAEHGWTFD